MRDLDQKQLITGDFLCIYGDVVANLSLSSALAAHRMRREKSKKAIMTMVLREAGDIHRTKSHHMRPIFVVDPEAERCVHYEQLFPGETARLDIPGEVFTDHPEVEVRADLIDCGIDICTPEVLAQYTDNFDWQMPRRGFLYGVLKDYETNLLTIHTHIVNEGYAARMKNLQSYNAVTSDITSRWTYPLCPDFNFLEDHSYQLQPRVNYTEQGVLLARSSNVKRRSILGRATSIGNKSVISDSVVGRRCIIGDRVRIEGAYIWDDAHIGDDTTIEKAVIAANVTIGRKCRIEAGALVSYGVRVADGMTVKAGSKLTTLRRIVEKDGPKIVSADSDPGAVGEGGVGCEMDDDDDDDNDDAEQLVIGEIYSNANHSISLASISTLNSEDDDADEDSSTSHHRTRSSRSESFASINSDESGDTRKKASDFHHEATSSIVEAMRKGDDADTVQLELQGLKLSSNAEGNQIRRAVAFALAKRISGLVEAGASPKDAAAKTIEPYKLIVQRAVGEDPEEQVELLLYLQTALLHRVQGSKIFLHACTSMAFSDLIDSDGVGAWWNDARSSSSDELEALRRDTKPLVDALVDDDEDDEDEEDSE